MEIYHACILREKSVMRRSYALLVVSFIIATITANAQTEKLKPPPPPPPKPEEVGKAKPPINVKEGESKTPPVITVKGQLADEFYERNPTVSEISGRASIIMIKKKDGTTENYDMSKKEEAKNFTDQYGRSPIPPPPPPRVIKTKT